LPRALQSANAAEFGYAGSGDNRSAFPKARLAALAECGTHAFLATEVDAYAVGEKTLDKPADNLPTAARGRPEQWSTRTCRKRDLAPPSDHDPVWAVRDDHPKTRGMEVVGSPPAIVS
jgi:hypothetical protein